MLTKTIKTSDWDGNEREEICYFNLSESELMEMELSTPGGFAKKMQSCLSRKDIPEMMEIFRNLILKSYGVKSPDGRRFIKSKELSEEFSQTSAYDSLYIELLTNPESATAFINGVVPKKISDKANSAEVKEQLKNHPALKMK